MIRFFSALAVSFSLLALGGVGFVLTSDMRVSDTGVGHVELDLLRVSLNELEDRLESLASGPSAGPTRVSRSAAHGDDAEVGEGDVEFAEGDGSGR